MQQTGEAMALKPAFHSFGEALRYFRKRAQLTQAELGRAVGYSREYIAQLEGDHRNPDPTTVAALFIPALDLTHSPADAARLVKLATASRGKSLRDYGITIHAPKRLPAQREQPANPIEQALSWYIEMDPESALRLANALEPMWMARNNYREARAWFSAILARSTSETVTRAEALLHASRFAQRQGDAGEAVCHARDALQIYRSNNDMHGACIALNALGWAMLDHGQDIPRARASFRECLLLAREINQPRLAMEALIALIHQSMPVTAPPASWVEIEADLDECERVAQQLHDERGSAFVGMERGFLQIARGNLLEALNDHRAALQRFTKLKIVQEIGWCEMAVGEVLWFMRDCAGARRRFQRGLGIFHRAGQSFGIAMGLHHLAQVDRCEGRLKYAEKRYLESLSLSEEQGNRSMIVRCVAGLGGVALAGGDAAQATRMLAWAQAQFDALPPFLSRYDIDDYRRIADEARVALGEAAFQQQWNAGKAAPLDQLITPPA